MLNVYTFILNFKHVTYMSQDKFHAESFSNIINLKIISFFCLFCFAFLFCFWFSLSTEVHAIFFLDDLKNHLMDLYAFDILIEIQYTSITVTIAEFLFIFFFQFY